MTLTHTADPVWLGGTLRALNIMMLILYYWYLDFYICLFVVVVSGMQLTIA